MFDWAVDRAKFGISQIQPDGTLPLELARGRRAFLCHLFAAMPLFMLAEAAYKNGENLFTENDNGLQRFGALDIKGAINPDVFKQLTGKDQVLTHVPSPSDLGWLEIYAQHYSDPRVPEILKWVFRAGRESRKRQGYQYIEQQMDESDLQSNASNSKRKQNAPQVLKVCPRDCFVISTTRNATANPRYRFGPNSEVT